MIIHIVFITHKLQIFCGVTREPSFSQLQSGEGNIRFPCKTGPGTDSLHTCPWLDSDNTVVLVTHSFTCLCPWLDPGKTVSFTCLCPWPDPGKTVVLVTHSFTCLCPWRDPGKTVVLVTHSFTCLCPWRYAGGKLGVQNHWPAFVCSPFELSWTCLLLFFHSKGDLATDQLSCRQVAGQLLSLAVPPEYTISQRSRSYISRQRDTHHKVRDNNACPPRQASQSATSCASSSLIFLSSVLNDFVSSAGLIENKLQTVLSVKLQQ